MSQSSQKGTSITNVWTVSREFRGLASAGGVGVVTRQLQMAMTRRGIRATTVLPLYRNIASTRHNVTDTGIQFTVPMDHSARKRESRIRVWTTLVQGITVYLIEAECYASKQGLYSYTHEEAERLGVQKGDAYYDFFEMNVTLQKAALELIQHLGERPDVIHCHDGHAALIPALMHEVPRYQRYFASIGSGITVHNAGPGYNQNVDDIPFGAAITELGMDRLRPLLHRNGIFPFLLGGAYAGFLAAVSENYAREILEVPREDRRTDYLGTACRQRDIPLTGVTNGIDPGEYDPSEPRRLGIAAGFCPARGDLAGKRACREALANQIRRRSTGGVRVFGSLSDAPESCLIGMVGRLTEQKGVPQLAAAMQELLDQDQNVQFVVLGAGTEEYERRLVRMTEDPRTGGRLAVVLGYAPDLALRVYAAIDFFVNSAEFEPCGLTDYVAVLMGAAPVVHLVGGLAKVKDAQLGYWYCEHQARELASTLRRAIKTFREDRSRHCRMIQRAAKHIHDKCTWDVVLQNGYLPLYQHAVEVANEPGKKGSRNTPG